MRRIVLIDGENLTHGLRELLGDGQEAAPRSAIDSFDFRGLIEEILSDEQPKEILWFGARMRRYTQSEEIKRRSEEAIAEQALFVNHIQQQRISFIKVGQLRAREAKPCPNCRRQEWLLIEKGVNVGMTVRMLAEANDQTELVLISADTDLLPAVRGAKKLNARVMLIGYEHRPVIAFAKEADATRMITRPLAQKYMEKRLL